MTYHPFIAEDGTEYGSFEVFYCWDSLSDPYGRIGPRGWYWHACFPGCVPDGDVAGPFATEAEAIAEAQS